MKFSHCLTMHKDPEFFNDQKTMTDAVPLFPVSEINKRYEEEKGREGFDLRSFVLTNFDFIGEKSCPEG